MTHEDLQRVRWWIEALEQATGKKLPETIKPTEEENYLLGMSCLVGWLSAVLDKPLVSDELRDRRFCRWMSE